MKHTGIEKKFPSYFKTFQLPVATGDHLTVYRGCITCKLEPASFTPSREDDSKNPSSFSLSAFEKPKDVKRFAITAAKMPKPWSIAKGVTADCCGIGKRTKDWNENASKKSSHVDWWLYENALPHEHFELIEDFAQYLAVHQGKE